MSLGLMPIGSTFGDRNYFGGRTVVFSVSSGSAVSFGARFFFQTGPSVSYQSTVNVVYQCVRPA